MSTRIIGAIVMSHSDDKGLVLPPNIAPTQAVLLVIIDSKTSSDERVDGFLSRVCEQLRNAHVSCVIDGTDRKLGMKHYDWEKQGIPVRLVVGASELDNDQIMVVRRDTSEKLTCNVETELQHFSTL
jgi:prolyl-tRNA synthetase